MPNRILREGIIDSDRMDQLTWAGECFYRRLHSVVDDYGCFDARPSILKSKLFPTEKKQAMVSLPDIGKWLTESVDAGLVRSYNIGGKPYLMVNDFRQEVRIKKRKFPPPPDEMSSMCEADDTHMHSICAPESIPKPIHTDTDVESIPISKPYQSIPEKFPVADANPDSFIEMFNFLTKKAFRISKKISGMFRARLKEGYTTEQIIQAVQNCFNDQYHKENPNYLTPEFILRNDKLDKYVNYTKVTTSTGVQFPNFWTKENEKKFSHDPKLLASFWAHLRKRGWVPVKGEGQYKTTVTHWELKGQAA